MLQEVWSDNLNCWVWVMKMMNNGLNHRWLWQQRFEKASCTTRQVWHVQLKKDRGWFTTLYSCHISFCLSGSFPPLISRCSSVSLQSWIIKWVMPFLAQCAYVCAWVQMFERWNSTREPEEKGQRWLRKGFTAVADRFSDFITHQFFSSFWFVSVWRSSNYLICCFIHVGQALRAILAFLGLISTWKGTKIAQFF